MSAMQQSWQVLREQSPRGSYARRRAAAVAGAAVFFFGLLAVFGLGRLLLLAFAAGVAVVGAALGTRLLRRRRPWRHLPAVRLRLVRELRRAPARLARPALLDAAPAAVRRRVEPTFVLARRNVRELRPLVERLAERGAARARLLHLPHPPPLPPERRRQAVELNVCGTRLRRDGSYEQAAQHHRAALEIFRELSDRRAEALTLNNLALAEGRAGDEETAVACFEEALAILRELDDHEREAQVSANLGLTLRRHGHDERAKELLEAALEKLEPESPAARQLEVQLRRAS